MPHEAHPAVLLKVLAGTIDMLVKELHQLPDKLRGRVRGPGPRSLRNWHKHVLALREEFLAAEGAARLTEMEPPPPAKLDEAEPPDAPDTP